MISQREFIDYIEDLVPLACSEEWDNCGLQVGDPRLPLRGIMLCLDATAAVVRAAGEKGANFVFAHHPLLFTPLRTVRVDRYPADVVREALVSGISIYAAHTNLDVVPGGVNDVLAKRLGLENCEVLSRTGEIAVYKLVVFVPSASRDEVAGALFEAGAGSIGPYRGCSFSTPGTGTFCPSSAAAPFCGTVGKMNEVDEFRLEVRVEKDRLGPVVDALVKVHPYETPAFDLYPLENAGRTIGLGRVGELPEVLDLPAVVRLVKETLSISRVRVAGGREDAKVKRLALCGGSGFSLYQAAVEAGADLFLTGDLKYHDARLVEAAGLPVVDAGHFATEAPVLEALRDEFCRYLGRCGGRAAVHIYEQETDPLQGW
jgi:dinuclear metal center YbgI/SA1388 family protein